MLYIYIYIYIYTHRTMRLSSPTLNYVVCVGAIFMYLAVFFYLLPTDNVVAVKARCVVRDVQYK